MISLLSLQMKLQQRIADNNYVLVAVSGAQHSNKLKDLLNDTPILGGEIGYFYNTILGPRLPLSDIPARRKNHTSIST